MKELTFETVNEEINNLNLDNLELELSKKGLDVSSKICILWNSMGKIIKLIAKIPMPRKWKKALKMLIKTMDGICS